MRKKLCFYLVMCILLLGLAGCGTMDDPSAQSAEGESQASRLVVEEHKVCPLKEDTPTHFEFNQRIDQEVFDLRAAWRMPSAAKKAESANEALGPFGYELRLHPDDPEYAFQLWKSEELVVDMISHFWPVTVSQEGDDFLLPVENDHGKRLLVRKGQVEPMNEVYVFQTLPIYAGNEVLHAQLGENDLVVVKNGEETIFSEKIRNEDPVSIPLRKFSAWQGSWVLEITDQVFINGESLNKQLGYKKIYHWQLINGEPFFFFEEGDKVKMSYAGQVLPYEYEEVIHYRCCEPAAFNVSGNEHMVWFYALKNGDWHYVEAGVYSD